MLNRRHRTLIAGGVLLLTAVLTVWGVARDEVTDIVINATIICFSCIGIK